MRLAGLVGRVACMGREGLAGLDLGLNLDLELGPRLGSSLGLELGFTF